MEEDEELPDPVVLVVSGALGLYGGRMRRHGWLMAVVVMTLAVASCGDNEDRPSPSPTPTPTATLTAMPAFCACPSVAEACAGGCGPDADCVCAPSSERDDGGALVAGCACVCLPDTPCGAQPNGQCGGSCGYLSFCIDFALIGSFGCGCEPPSPTPRRNFLPCTTPSPTPAP